MLLWLGGYVSVGASREAKANNKYMGKEYNALLQAVYILYIDANNLYGLAMSRALPYGKFEWITDEKLEEIRLDIHKSIMKIDHEGPEGVILEVDLEIDPELHDKFNELPPAPIKRCVNPEELSRTYQQPLMADIGTGTGIYRTPKLICDLANKTGYIAHYSTLQEYIKMGVKITKVHRGIQFCQKAWMAEYINFNTFKRSQARNEFEKNFWKLMNNSSFGKTIEQKRRRQNVVIVTNEEQARRYTNKPTVQKIIPINETTCIFLMKRLSVYLDKPIAVGTSVCEIAKSVMYDMHYTCIKKFYGKRAILLYTDTGKTIGFFYVKL